MLSAKSLERKEVVAVEKAISSVSSAISRLHAASRGQSLSEATLLVSQALYLLAEGQRSLHVSVALERRLLRLERSLYRSGTHVPKLFSRDLLNSKSSENSTHLSSILHRLDHTISELRARSAVTDEHRFHTVKGEARVHFHQLHELLLDLDRYRERLLSLLEHDRKKSILHRLKR